MKKLYIAKSKTEIADFTDRPLPRFARLYKSVEVDEKKAAEFEKIRADWEAMQLELSSLMSE